MISMPPRASVLTDAPTNVAKVRRRLQQRSGRRHSPDGYGERAVRVDQSSEVLKADVRLYTYAGDVLLAAASLYQGQTTNLRTPGGGFAPVFQV